MSPRAPRPLLVFLLGALAALPARAEPLPDPLTLEYALSLASEPHPELEVARAGVAAARGGVVSADARGDLNLSFEGRARWVEPPDTAPDQSRDDHKASLFLRKNLYDFGRSTAQENAARNGLAAAESLYEDALGRRRVAIMERFFAVLLADKEFSRTDENMAVVYVGLDRLRQRHELGQVSELRLRAAESEYQSARLLRHRTEGQQQLARAALADLLNRPGELSANLAPPDLPQVKRAVPEAAPLQEEAVRRNPMLGALRAQVLAARERVAAARAEFRPRLAGEIETSAYTRELATNDKWRAGVTLEVPLYSGGTITGLAAQRHAELYERESRLRQAEMELRRQVLDLILRLRELQAEREEAVARRDYRELALERARTVYEQEVSADLGDAMVHLTEAELSVMRADFETALAWARLDALTGGAATAGEER